ncbi:MAG: hypothetical protein ACJATT_005483 [Myxococcota bacterium]|jgi:hypothetical protein
MSCQDVSVAALAVAQHRDARDLLVEHDGREIDKTDVVLRLFDDVDHAMAYAVAYHRATGGSIGLDLEPDALACPVRPALS